MLIDFQTQCETRALAKQTFSLLRSLIESSSLEIDFIKDWVMILPNQIAQTKGKDMDFSIVCFKFFRFVFDFDRISWHF